MGRYCILCYNHDKAVSYHRIPTNVELRAKWAEFCRLKEIEIKDSFCLCSNHFITDDFLPTTSRNKLLKRGVIPTVFTVKRRKRCLNSNETSAKGSDATSNTTVLMSSERELVAHENMEDSLKNNVDVSGQKLISDKNIIKDFWKNDMDIDQVLADSVAESVTSVRSSSPPHMPRYIGDIRTPHLATPRRAKRALNLTKVIVKRQRRKILSLQQTTTRLKKRINNIKELVKHLKEKNLISEDAMDQFKVYFCHSANNSSANKLLSANVDSTDFFL